MKPLLIRDKEFLKSLYNSNSVSKSKNILYFASDTQLNTLVKFLHFVSNGEIKVRKEDFDHLSKSQLQLIRKHFESKAALKRQLKDRAQKLQSLSKLAPIFHYLLYTLFNQI